MLWQLSGLKGFRVQASDGRCGKVKDFLIDDNSWAVRWIVGDVGDWLAPHQVLLSPSAFAAPEEATQVCPTTLTKFKIEHSPDITEDPPLVLQKHLTHFTTLGRDALTGSGRAGDKFDPHLRSIEEVTGYRVIASDGDAGTVVDFALDDSGWHVTHLIVRWTSWWKGHLVSVPVSAVSSIDIGAKTVSLNSSSREVKAGTPYGAMTLGARGITRAQTGWESVM